MIKNDQEGKRNPYKCMNVMKQDVMDDKIIKKKCKTCAKTMHARGSQQIEKLSSCY